MDIDQPESLQMSLHRKHSLQVDAGADHPGRTQHDLDLRSDLHARAEVIEGCRVNLVLQDDERDGLTEGTSLAAVDLDVNAHAGDDLGDRSRSGATSFLLGQSIEPLGEFLAAVLADATSRDDREGALVFGRDGRTGKDDVDFLAGVDGSPLGLGLAGRIAELRRREDRAGPIDVTAETAANVHRCCQLRLLDRIRLHVTDPF